MKKHILGALFAAATFSSAARAECIVADPSPTPLNVRTVPYGRIVDTLTNGQWVEILDTTLDNRGRVWAYIGTDNGPTGWVFRDYIVCKGETRR